jgi:hypothetical protein
VPETSPARAIARLPTELRVSGVGQVAIGVACLVVALTAGALEPVRALVPFAVTLVAVGAFSLYASRWMRVAATPPAPADARIEDRQTTMRRSVVKLTVAVLIVALAVALGPGLGVVLGGLVAAVGAVDVRNYFWVRGREETLDREIHRELGRFPLAGGARALYTRPMNESTLAT